MISFLPPNEKVPVFPEDSLIMRIALIRCNELRHKYLSISLSMANNDFIDLVDLSAVQSRKKIYESSEFRQHFSLLMGTELKLLGPLIDAQEKLLRPKLIPSPDSLLSREILDGFSPDVIVTFGCSIIPSTLISHFEGKFLGIHLGLSPYYRGSGSNFWPFYFDEISCVGFTIMNIDSGIDTGAVIHQARVVLDKSDDLHSAGVKCSIQMTDFVVKVCNEWPQRGVPINLKQGRYLKRSDFNVSAINAVEQKINGGSIAKYLELKRNIDLKFPIITLR